MTTLLRVEAVLVRVGVSRATLYRLVRDGRFPAPSKVGAASVWHASDVDAWIASLRPAAPSSSPPAAA